MSITNKFDTRNKNIDAIIDMMIETQKENGVESHMAEVLYDPDTNERVNRFKRKRLEELGVDLSRYGNHDCVKCGGGCGKKENKPVSNIERGVFVYNENDLVDESDEQYVCEYCAKVSYDGTYSPEVCDFCDECEMCNDMMRGECDGCCYSNFYNGASYGSLMEMGTTMRDEDSKILDELESGKEDAEVHVPTRRFTVLSL